MSARSVSSPVSFRETLRASLDFFRSDLRGPDVADLRDAQRDEILSRTSVLVWIAFFVMPVGIWFFVFKVAPERLMEAVWIVLAAVAAVLAHRTLVLRGVFDTNYHLAMFLLVGGVLGPTAGAIMAITASTGVDFLFAFFLIYFAFASLFPADVIWIVATSAAIIASFLASQFWRPLGFVLDGATISALIYLVTLTFICVILNRVICKLFFRERRSRNELAAANEGLRELDRVKTSFFSNVSHEIRTPLTLILTPLTHVLQSDGERLDPVLRDRLNGIRANANRLLKMVNSLLDFAKLESGQTSVSLARVDLRDLATYGAALFAGTASEKHIDLQLDLQSDADLAARSDLDMLEKILINLLGNAIKFTPAGGRIVLRCARDGDWFVLSVRDTGPGIAPENHSGVFGRFVQIHDANSASLHGTGIGLSMVQEYCKLLGGTVELESALGEGATFTVRLPAGNPRTASTDPSMSTEIAVETLAARTIERRAKDAELAVADIDVSTAVSRPTATRDVDPGKPFILAVDDNDALLGLVASILSADYNLCFASNGHAALALLENHPVDLVLSDVMMPGMSGLELCRAIRDNERTRHIPVVLLTARGGTVRRIEGLEQGADDYIGKPFDPDELKARIRSLFDLRKTTSTLAHKSAELETALEKLKQEELKIIESEKLRSLGVLAAGLFHELHNYMNIITNGAVPLIESLGELRSRVADKTIEVGGLDLAEMSELADLIVVASRAASGLTGELKGFAHFDKGSARRVDVNTTIRSTIRMLGRANSHLFEVDCDSVPMIVECVPTRLTQVFTNLFKNAIDAMNGQGKITISTRVAGSTVTAIVTDTGPGIPLEHVSKLFEPFHTTKKQGEGLGLGLSLSRKVLHDIGGDLQYDVSYATGARFILTMPLSRAPSISPPARPGTAIAS